MTKENYLNQSEEIKGVNQGIREVLGNIDQEHEVVYAIDAFDRLASMGITDEDLKDSYLKIARSQATHRVVNQFKSNLEAKISECINNNRSAEAIDASAQLHTVSILSSRLAPIPDVPEGVPPAKRGFTTLREFTYKNSRFSPR